METWKRIPGYPGYEVSDRGRVRSYKGVNQHDAGRARPRLMKQRIGSDGYPRITLQDKDGRKVVRQVHLLVAKAFLGPARGRKVLHKNGKRHQISLSNLEYGTHKANMDDKYRHGTHGMGSNNSQAIISAKDRREIKKLRGKYTQREIAEMFGISRQAVSDIQRNVTWNSDEKHLKKCRSMWEKFLKNDSRQTLRACHRCFTEGLEHEIAAVRKECRAGLRVCEAVMREKGML